jgi:parallel beta-helix repeat protein
MKTTLTGKFKRIFLFFSFTCLITLPTRSQTKISGDISTDSTFDLAGSPYIINSYLSVQAGATVTIEEGVTVKFENNSNLYVYGTLNATGVIFTSNNATPEPGIWGQIQVGNYSNRAVVNLTTCSIQYGQQLYIYNGTATLHNTNVLNMNYNGINTEDNGILNMSGGNISTTSTEAKNGYSGVNAGSNDSVTLSGVSIQNYNYGISLNTNSNVNCSDMNINSCNYPINYNDYANFSLAGTNNFSGNTYNVVKVGFSSLYNTFCLSVISIPYYFPWGFQIQEAGSLTIASNNILKFPNDYSLNVYGILKADATIEENIYFTSYQDDNLGGDSNNDATSTAPSSKNWKGIIFNHSSKDTSSLMRRCVVRYAGSDNTGGITMYSASPTIDSCNVSNSYIGIYMQGTSNPVLTNNTIGSSQMTPIAMSFEANPVMNSNTLSFSDNAYDAIGIIGGTMTANGTLKVRSFTTVPNITYLLLDQIIVPTGKTLTIDKGITLKSYSSDGYNHRIVVYGTLNANATADSIINFTSAKDDNYGYPADCNKDGTITSPAIGDWGGIVFEAGSNGILNYCRIKYAKIDYYNFSSCSNTEGISYPAVGIIDANPTISNCEFIDLYHAISCYRSANPAILNDLMENILYTPINISGPSNPTISGITFTNVGWKALGLLGGNVCLNGTIKKRDLAGFSNITYVLLSDMTINSGTYINVEPGVVIKSVSGYKDDHYYYSTGKTIYVDGGFKIDGTADQNIIFTSIKDDNAGNPYDTNGDGNASTPTAGDWGSIKYRATSDDSYCLINNAMMKYAGCQNEGGVTFENAGGKLKNTIITNSSNYGVYCNGNSTPTIDSVTIQNCGLDPVAMSLTANPAFSNITFTSNSSQAIKIIEGTLSTIATLTSRSMAGITNIAYVIDKLVISNNAKLTIQPGVVIKFRGDSWPYNTFIYVNGSLIANGTPTNKIYFTSYNDDSKGGDSNNNGNSTVPQRNDWGQGNYYNYRPGGIIIDGNSIAADTVNLLRNCEIAYAGTGLRISNSHATIDSCILQLCNYFGATIIGSANPEFNNCQFYNITFSPIELSMFSDPVFTDCSALNVGYMALAVVPEIYSKSGTVPIRSFGGYSNISYLMKAPCTINSGCTITIPAGVVFKSAPSIGSEDNTSDIANGFIVNGRLNIDGTKDNPVVFTNAADDTYGNPKDMNQDGSATQAPDGGYYDYWYGYWYNGWSGNWITYNDISDDASFINNAIFKYAVGGVTSRSASPSIKNVRFEDLRYGIDMNGISAPKIDSCVFNNLKYYPMQISLVSYPASTNGNTISGSTYKAIKVREETLTQDVSLPKRNFGGKSDIPYYFENYEIGTSASLTIDPGVICKFRNNHINSNTSNFLISKGLIAFGGSSKDSTIVFTSILDDFYGGDSNSDSTATSPSNTDWLGLNFADQSLDPLCKLKNCIIRYAEYGALTTSASPSFERCNFNNNSYGVKATAASNPTFTNCDFSENQYYAINNVDKSFVINAPNCWWGSNTGPIQSDSYTDATLEQQFVTSDVNYTPWDTTGTINPIMGDVSLNGLVQAYDASLVLKNVVGLLTLSNVQRQVADVSGNGDISAYDASLILQFIVGNNSCFPVNLVPKLRGSVVSAEESLTVGSAVVIKSDEFSVPVSVSNVNGLYGADIKLRFNPAYLHAEEVTNQQPSMNMMYKLDNTNGLISIAMACVNPVSVSGILDSLKFKVISPTSVNTEVGVDEFLDNENNLTSSAIPGSITIQSNVTALPVSTEDISQRMDPIYPNPFKGEATLVYHLNESSRWVNIDIFNLTGQKVASLINKSEGQGTYSIRITDKEYPLQAGNYIIRMKTSNFSQSQLFQVEK